MLRAVLILSAFTLSACGTQDAAVPAGVREGVAAVTEAVNDGDVPAVRAALTELTSDVKTARDGERLTPEQATTLLDAAGRLAAGLPKPTPSVQPSPSVGPRPVAPAPQREDDDDDDKDGGKGKGKGGKDD